MSLFDETEFMSYCVVTPRGQTNVDTSLEL